MMRIVFLAAIFLLTGCASAPPAPEIQTKDVHVGVAQPCKVDTKDQRPSLMTLPQVRAALAAAPSVDDKAKIVTTQLLAYMGWLPVVEAAMQGCQMPPDPSK